MKEKQKYPPTTGGKISRQKGDEEIALFAEKYPNQPQAYSVNLKELLAYAEQQKDAGNTQVAILQMLVDGKITNSYTAKNINGTWINATEKQRAGAGAFIKAFPSQSYYFSWGVDFLIKSFEKAAKKGANTASFLFALDEYGTTCVIRYTNSNDALRVAAVDGTEGEGEDDNDPFRCPPFNCDPPIVGP